MNNDVVLNREDRPFEDNKINRVSNESKMDQVFFSFLGSAPTVEIHGHLDEDYRVEFINYETGNIIKTINCKSRHTVISDIRYFIPWRFVITNIKTNEILKDYKLEYTGKTILVTYESSAMGDSIAWMPYVDEFRKKHNCKLICSSFHNALFKDIYPDIEFVERGHALSGIHVQLSLGWFGTGRASNKNPRDCHTIPLQAVATDILGLDYNEIRPLIKYDNRPKLLREKYVVITSCSTAQFKYWNLPGGWQSLIDWFNSRGYKVVNVGKQPNNFRNVYNYTGKREISDLKNVIQNAEYFIGLPSGLSWLSWALNKKSVMITGISEAYCEYRLDNYRAENISVCHGCFNNPIHAFAKSDWLYCPEHKNTPKHFQCTKEISLDMVKSSCLKLETDIRKSRVYYSMSDVECLGHINSLIN